MNRNAITLSVLNSDGTTSEMVTKRKSVTSIRENTDGTTFIVFDDGPPVVAVEPGYEEIRAWTFGMEREA